MKKKNIDNCNKDHHCQFPNHECYCTNTFKSIYYQLSWNNCVQVFF